MIPKTIHYCWFGGNPLPKLAKKCIKSWKKYCPDYKIIEWNEDNFDINATPLYVRQAYEAKKWAFVTDYVRLKVVYDYGGVYLDTDVQLLKSLDDLLDYTAYFGFEDDNSCVATGLGFGSEKNTKILEDILSQYEDIVFIRDDGSIDDLACPARNTEAFKKYGLVQNNTTQFLPENIAVFSTEYFCPLSYLTNKKNITINTYSIHLYAASWLTKEKRKDLKETIRKNRKKAIEADFKSLKSSKGLLFATLAIIWNYWRY